MFQIKDSVAMITGGASGIGLAIAEKLFVQNPKGIAIVDINKQGQVVADSFVSRFGPGKAIFIEADVSDPKQLESAFQITVNEFKQLDAVFNNAGILDEFNWEKTISVNLYACIKGTMLAVEEYLPKYSHYVNPVVVNTSSTAAHTVSRSMPVYSATKSGIVSFTKAIGLALDFYKVRVIAICPGLTMTPILDTCLDKVKQHNQKYFKRLLSKTDPQHPIAVADVVLDILEFAASGSVWEITNGLISKLH